MNLAQIILNGLVSGMLVALPAVALSLIFGVLRFPNFAIGGMLTAGAYLAFVFDVPLGLPFPLAAVLGVAGMTLVAVAMGRVVFEPLRDRGSITLLVASMGAALILENVARFSFGNSIRSYEVPIARPWQLLELRVNREQLVILAVTVLAMLAVHLLLNRTRLGRAMRAVADNPDLAAVRGIERGRVNLCVWAIAGVLSGAAGVLIALDTALAPNMGWSYIVPVFAAAILGGLGSPFGAVAGALALGLVAELSLLVLPAHYRSAVAFVVMVLLLLLRPSGLFGRARLSR